MPEINTAHYLASVTLRGIFTDCPLTDDPGRRQLVVTLLCHRQIPAVTLGQRSFAACGQ